MRPSERDAAYLWDMLQACRELTEFTADTELEDFIADRKLCLAVERCLEIIGEAAGRVTPEFQDREPSIAWRQIKGMRNILAHEYGQIDYEVVHSTVLDDIPRLVAALEAVLPPE